MHKIIIRTLIQRGETSLINHRNEEINYLDKCLSLSNPFGRFSARLIGFIYKLVIRGKITQKRLGSIYNLPS